MRRCTECRSMYSLMSMRQMNDSSSKRNFASCLHTSVLPTPVGPRKRKEPRGRLCECSSAREMRTTFVMEAIASFCPSTRLQSSLSMWMSFSRSPVMSFCTGMPVARAMTCAMSLAVTESCVRNPSTFVACLSTSISFFRAGIRPWRISLARAKSPSVRACS
ncbi:hypothetical protein DQ04_19791000 [Trypanosoma grayi]|uniref:hypothetical protein n=1 Tax=Trypanosoma grayi TaxID=71804 RepID=UPI0004F47483|nr:hypothetical protein DQ04_19791000 [Trypanosoma grayi]KEG05639.1 hypothetical protein DQ04_19791000 [Trypanosoma grayi]